MFLNIDIHLYLGKPEQQIKKEIDNDNYCGYCGDDIRTKKNAFKRKIHAADGCYMVNRNEIEHIYTMQPPPPPQQSSHPSPSPSQQSTNTSSPPQLIHPSPSPSQQSYLSDESTESEEEKIDPRLSAEKQLLFDNFTNKVHELMRTKDDIGEELNVEDEYVDTQRQYNSVRAKFQSVSRNYVDNSAIIINESTRPALREFIEEFKLDSLDRMYPKPDDDDHKENNAGGKDGDDGQGKDDGIYQFNKMAIQKICDLGILEHDIAYQCNVVSNKYGVPLTVWSKPEMQHLGVLCQRVGEIRGTNCIHKHEDNNLNEKLFKSRGCIKRIGQKHAAEVWTAVLAVLKRERFAFIGCDEASKKRSGMYNTIIHL